MKSNRASRVVLTTVAVGFLAACSLNPKEDPTRYYVLSNMADDASLLEAMGPSADALATGLRVGVRPVSFPSYLKRSRMVTRLASNELRYMEAERWGEPLEEAFLYAVGANLGVLLGTDEVILHPWYSTERPEFAVVVDVVRFERDQLGNAHLVVRWEIRDAGGEIVATDGFSTEEMTTDPASISSSVQAQSRSVAALSRQIADAIRNLAS
jgi:uncharacterized lipoprotein YmbA